ncbi:SAM-dependent methyltransferase [Amycolatopsis sp. NPDC051371]|uniref:SAM-dependent methyltransferase n=1 Tax=Amycolatopsis sp. NPDC051371 TaxID=3155800 RepID=UPI00343BA142
MTPPETTQRTATHQTNADDAPWWWKPCGTDPARINLAYLYDAFREAKNTDGRSVPSVKFAHNNEHDAALRLDARMPGTGFVFRSERAFLDRAAAYLVARQGISSIVVAGAGLPHISGHDDLHSLVRRCEASNRNRTQTTTRASVIYVERDPLTLAQLRTLADADNGVHVVDADPWDPTAMWDTLYNSSSENPGLVSPDDGRVALLLGAVMSFHGGSRAEATQVVQDHINRLPVGAFVAMTHLLMPEHPDLAAQALEFEDVLQHHGPGTGSLATHAQIEAMIHGTAPLPPGIVPAFTWYPDGPPTDPPVCGNFTAAVLTQKPGPDDNLPEPPWRPTNT